MVHYFVRRFLLALLTLLFITFLVYGLIRLMPGDPILMKLANANPDRPLKIAEIEKTREIYGLTKPWYIAYWQWLSHMLRGDLGDSITRPARVSEVIGQRIGPTLLIEVASLILTYILAIPIGLYATARSGKLDERITSTLLYVLYSLPVFVAALFLQVLFAIQLRGTPFELPLFGMYSDDYDQLSFFGKIWDVSRHAILPIVCSTYGSLAYYSRFIHSNMQEVIRQDYIRTARAKGIGPVRVLVHHAFRNTLIPLVTMFGLTLPYLLSGSIILETIFSWPGMGRLFLESIFERDYPTMMSLFLLFAVLTLLGQMLADFLYAVVDPRVTYT
jgi:peptide/nickel transport system permease protein